MLPLFHPFSDTIVTLKRGSVTLMVEIKGVTIKNSWGLNLKLPSFLPSYSLSLLMRLEIRGTELNWLNSYLSNRKQFVSVNRHPSSL